MYDPARDAWNASTENSADEKDLEKVPNVGGDGDESGDTEDEAPVRIETRGIETHDQNNDDYDGSTEQPESLVDRENNGKSRTSTGKAVIEAVEAVAEAAVDTLTKAASATAAVLAEPVLSELDGEVIDEKNSQSASSTASQKSTVDEREKRADVKKQRSPSPTSPPKELKKPSQRADVGERDREALEPDEKLNRTSANGGEKKENISEDSNNSEFRSTSRTTESTESKEETHSTSQKSTIDDKETTDNVKRQRSPSPASPPRKLKKPSRRSDVGERDRKAQELREKLDKAAADDIRAHYNERPNKSIEERTQSPIIKLRSFNNLIKSVLIQIFSRPRQVVLDIGCGKGGDLQKWSKQRISGLIGVDIADISIEQAKERYEHLRQKSFWADFCVGDAFERTIEDIVHPDAFPVDFVSSQFTIHYSFENEQRARTMLSNVSRALKPGGTFIGTTPDSDRLLEHISKLPAGVREWGNSAYRIQFEDEPPKSNDDLKDIFGYKYNFFLDDAVTNVVEFMVPFEAFTELAKEYGLRLVLRRNFLDFFNDELASRRGRDRILFFCRILKVYKEDGTPGIEGDQREAAGIYTVFAFEKE
ncbi:Abd1p [Sugiyamaella lignohabitans]|uniref:mRNA cap guanine-N(7) methyltransferase n=1 Tax=Sugiyamaella lignohabitans TaxID=796027 RepID=A0A167EDM0_9ASCO|nr:Abd1p [Sugiyamaella lignohabitans]ANB13940.1 Abd1p [Sugiyamaella lignohabitans]